MDILILLIPLSLLLVGVIAWVMLWAARSGQFDDLEGPAHSILMDDDTPHKADPTPGNPDDPTAP
jgi:cbb3-type cytochrome oxidase maturation protein